MTERTPLMPASPPAEPVDEPAAVIPLRDGDPERALLERHAEGDRAAFGELMQMYSSPVYGYLVRSGFAPADRDDLYQDVCCKLHRAAATRPPTGPVRPWVFSIVIHTVRDHFRRVRVRSVVRLDGEAEATPEPESSAPDRCVEARETATWIETQIARLPLPQREALLLCCVDDLSLREASEALEVPVDTVKTRLRRARLALAEAARRRADAIEREAAR